MFFFFICDQYKVYIHLGTARGCAKEIPKSIMKQLDQQRIVSDKHCSNMTSLELSPGSASNSVDMCVCKTSNCNLGPKEGPDYDDNMIGATMPVTEISNDTTGL